MVPLQDGITIHHKVDGNFMAAPQTMKIINLDTIVTTLNY